MREENLSVVAREFAVKATSKGNDIFITGTEENIKKAETVIRNMENICNGIDYISSIDLELIIDSVKTNDNEKYNELKNCIVAYTHDGKLIRPRTYNQLEFIKSVKNNSVNFVVGSSGTGKTMLSIAIAIKELLDKRVDKVVLSRPAVEAGEKLGFMPGNESEKLAPYLRPLYDYIEYIVGKDKLNTLLLTGKIEIRSLAFMRGSDFKNNFVVLDEAQNATKEQMLMFLTRLSNNSKMVICGDVKQTDLISKGNNGLGDAIERLSGVDGIGVSFFEESDIVRHPLVKKIVEAYNN